MKLIGGNFSQLINFVRTEMFKFQKTFPSNFRKSTNFFIKSVWDGIQKGKLCDIQMWGGPINCVPVFFSFKAPICSMQLAPLNYENPTVRRISVRKEPLRWFKTIERLFYKYRKPSWILSEFYLFILYSFFFQRKEKRKKKYFFQVTSESKVVSAVKIFQNI